MVEPPDWRSAAKNLLPPATRRRDAAERVRRTAKSLAVSAATVREAATSEVRTAPISAKAWLADHHRTNESEQARTRLAGGLRGTTGPPLAVVVDARGARAGSVLATRSSLESQWVSGGRIHVAATAEELSEAVDALAEEEASIPLAVVKAGDTFRPDFAARVLDAFWEQPGLRMVHWDEAAGDHGEGLWVRPSWSPDLLLSANAWGRAFAVRARDWTGFRPESGDAAWWEVLLQSALDPADVRRLARVAMVGTRHEPSPGLGSALVGAELARRGWPARAESMGNAVWLDWDREPLPSVSIVIPTRHNTPLLDRLLPTLVDTDYADFEVVVIDNSGETKAKANWYARWKDRLDLKVLWWEHPFNYSAVNNHAASHSRGEVLVFLNDDTEATSPDWLRQLVGWASRPGIGTVGAQLIDGDGLIQHGGVVVGMDGSAGHLFAGGAPHSNTLLGHTDWTRNVLASTAACVALRREVFDACGGFDERFVLCGSDVNLGLQAHVRGHRNVVLPSVGMRHMESATLGPGGGVPEDQFASWWHYQRWITGGDPFFSPSLSLRSHWPEPKPPAERPAHHVMLESMGRPAEVFRQSALEETATDLALAYPVGNAVVEAVRKGHAAVSGFREVKTVNWVLPPFDNPFYGGLATILRLADQLERDHGVEQRFVILDPYQENFYRSAVAAGQQRLADCDLVFLGGDGLGNLDRIPPADAVMATMWTTAYVAATAPEQVRRFYLIQDFEPGFYPGGSVFALAEETYRLGLYGICNTEPIHSMYTERYGGTGNWFLPAVDRDVFHPPAIPRSVVGAGSGVPGDPVRVFVYARPGHWRNCWEIAKPALEAIKGEFGEGVHLVTAGSWASPDDIGGGIEHLGLLDVRSTGDLYRRCDVGVALTVSEHPSYLPLELMACGVPVVAFDIPEAEWILRHEKTGLRARQTVEGLREQLSRMVREDELRSRCSSGALAHVNAHHSDWNAALSGVYEFLCDPAS